MSSAIKKQMKALREAASRSDTPTYIVVLGWSVGLSKNYGGIRGENGEDSWHFSASLWPRGRSSTVDDWRVLGALAKEVGAPEQPITPIDSTPPGGIHHWHWFEVSAEKLN